MEGVPAGMNKKQWIAKLKPFWKEFRSLESTHNKKVMKLEKQMRKALKDDDLEFAFCDGEAFGIGFGMFNEKNETIGIFHDSDLDD
jgi:uncharacterized protein YgfB (UPF0149 family)